MKKANWEKFCARAVVEALHPGGAVLELGFSGGVSSLEIETYHPQSHVIIGLDEGNVNAAKEWVKKKGLAQIQVWDEPWDQSLPQAGVFDAILAVPLTFHEGSEQDPFAPEIVKRGKKLVGAVAEQFPDLKKMRYTDAELEDFCRSFSKEVPESLSRFLEELEENGQIDFEQKKRLLHKFHLPPSSRPAAKGGAMRQTVRPFLQICLDSHMRIGSRFAAYFSDATSKFEDPYFFQQIIPAIHLNFREWIVTSPDDREEQALAIWIEKLA